MNQTLETGTTTVGITLKDAVIMATERRVTMENFIMHKNGKKLFQIDTYTGMTIAGLVGDAQVLVRYMKAELELYRLQRRVNMPVEAVATLLSNMLNQVKYMPYMVQLLVGGIDTAPHVFSIDAAGGSVEDIYASTGSGSPFVYGVLESQYSEKMTVDEGVDLVIKAISAAKQRDSASGGMIDVAVITKKDGYVQLPTEQIESRIRKLGLIL
ncbi:archaeal proteasome endopeptidase complex subunit beta [Thermoplasma sp.]|uniref:archaeal proteasome endopeptidase complex subunit beta n=1 Tax=Thermoplasma sp. TaxID=1973142 RepID=UPI00127FD757|nr:archaeal proteasome endopeptidase complex subunit beta [Thermoplasma sp.]KAA8923504.1 MAG: archaeal proteasome endopeptidase complex subunit beta [Thermoplasma sp.]